MLLATEWYLLRFFFFSWDGAGVDVGSRADGDGALVGTDPPTPLSTAAPWGRALPLCLAQKDK